MEDEKLLNITNSIEEKLGKDASATIADDFGILMTENAKTQETIKNQAKEIEDLKARNEKLVSANGNLLQQIPMGKEPEKPSEKETEEKVSHLSWKDAFDSKGNFIH